MRNLCPGKGRAVIDCDVDPSGFRLRPKASVRQRAAALLVVRRSSHGADLTASGVEQPRSGRHTTADADLPSLLS